MAAFRGRVRGVSGWKGNVVGDAFPCDWGVDSSSLEMRYRFGTRGERWRFGRTDVLRAFPFSEHLPGHLLENGAWSALAAHYMVGFINVVVRIYFHDAGNQLMLTGSPVRDVTGCLFQMRSALSVELGWFWHKSVHFLVEAACWTRFRLHLNTVRARLAVFWPASILGGLLVVLMSPVGFAWQLNDLRKKR